MAEVPNKMQEYDLELNFIPYLQSEIIPVFEASLRHRWKLPGNYPVFTVVMVICHYVERTWIILITPNFWYNIYDHGKIIQVNQLIYIYNHS